MTIVAAIQMASGPNVSANLLEAERLIGEAVKQGARLIVLPENFAIMGKDQDQIPVQETFGKGPIQDFLSNQARQHGVWLVGGTVPLQSSRPDKVRASCLLYNDKGENVVRYDKMHLFDVSVLESEETYTESRTIEPGDAVVVVDSPFGRLGLAVCYDLRFPELFRAMLDEGMEVLVLPSAFTAITGKAHWETLLRCRAIENLCYVIAPNQGGYHLNGRETYGDSIVIDPWGTILNRLGKGAGVVTANLDIERVRTTRKHFPSISHRRLFCK